MFCFHSANAYHSIIDGIKIKTLNYGSNMLMAEFHLQKGTQLPEHSHPYEQSGYLIEGSMKLFINDISRIMNPGDSWSIHENIKHKAVILENSVAIEVFSPVREDYMKYKNEGDMIQ